MSISSFTLLRFPAATTGQAYNLAHIAAGRAPLVQHPLFFDLLPAACLHPYIYLHAAVTRNAAYDLLQPLWQAPLFATTLFHCFNLICAYFSSTFVNTLYYWRTVARF